MNKFRTRTPWGCRERVVFLVKNGAKEEVESTEM